MTDSTSVVVNAAQPIGGEGRTSAPSSALSTTVMQPQAGTTTAATPDQQDNAAGSPQDQQAFVDKANAAVQSNGTPASQDQRTDTGSQGVNTSNVQPVAQSEPTPQSQQDRSKQVDPRYMQWFQQYHPDIAKIIDSAATEAGIDPNALAFHKYQESQGMMEETPRGSSGEIGPGQIMPATAKQFDRNGQLDVHNPVDNLRMSAAVIKDNDDKFGRNTPSSFLAYQAGAGTVNKIASDPEFAHTYAQAYPQAIQRMQSAFPFKQTGMNDIQPGHIMSAPALVQAGTKGGPDGFIQTIASTAAPGSDMTEAWRQAEGSMTQYFLFKGDVAGAQHARDYVLQMSHTGAMQYMMMGHEMLQSGDAAGAGRALAKAHAFFPDGTMGQFGVDSKGQLWGQQVDEQTGQVVGRFKVTPDTIAQTINTIQNPKQYLEALQSAQKITETNRHNTTEETLTAGRDANTQAHQLVTEQNTANRNTETNRHNLATEGNKIPGAATPEQANKAADTLYGPDSDNASMPIEQRAKLSSITKDSMLQGSSATEAQFMAEGLGKGKMGLGQPQGDRVPVIGKQDGQVHGYISKGLAARLAGSQAPGASQGVSTSPIGAGAATPVARAAGITSNLAGTQTQSSAVPTQPGQ